MLGGLAKPQAAQVAVGLSLVVQARDGLLPDVAALGEAHRAFVEPRLLWNRVGVEVEAIARVSGLDAQALGGVLGRLLEGAGGANRARLLGRTDHVHAEVRPHVQAVLSLDERVLDGRRLDLERGVGGRTDEREEGALGGHVGVTHVAADPVHGYRADEGGENDGLGVDPDPVLAAEDAHVAAHLPLVGEQRRIAALARAQRLDVVGHLALEELGGFGARQAQLAAGGAIDESGALTK